MVQNILLKTDFKRVHYVNSAQEDDLCATQKKTWMEYYTADFVVQGTNLLICIMCVLTKKQMGVSTIDQESCEDTYVYICSPACWDPYNAKNNNNNEKCWIIDISTQQVIIDC